MTSNERRSVFALAFLYASRMLGLFMVLPVFMIYGKSLNGASDVLLGVAIGIYGLSQALFQIPFGALSDRFGRKPLILFGLLLFFVGSVVAATASDVYTVIAGRFLQGAGAIASVLMALLSDLTSEESRTKAMALVGMSIGLSFSLALVLGPLIAEVSGLQGVFWVTAGLALVGVFWLYWCVPTPVHSSRHRDTRLFKDQLSAVLKNSDLMRLDIGIFMLHLSLTAMFIAVPISLLQQAGLAVGAHWKVYLSVMVLSFFAMVPLIIIGEKRQKMKGVFVFAIALLSFSALTSIWTQHSFTWFWASLFFFFMAFNLLEASLPSLVSKLSPAGAKGTAMGVYSTSQFLGAFFGGLMGGWVLARHQEQGVYLMVSLLAIVWLIIATSMRKPSSETAMTLNFLAVPNTFVAESISAELSSVRGVEDVVVVIEDGVAYLKVVKSQLDQNGLDEVLRKYRNPCAN